MSSKPPVNDDNEASSAEVPAWQPPQVRRVTGGGTSPQVEKALSDVRNKIYPRSVTGIFARWRIVMVFVTQLILYGLPWLQCNDRQAVLFDLAARKFYI